MEGCPGSAPRCEGLTQVNLSPALTHIGEKAFGNCFGLTQITLQPSLTYIGEHAFENCTSIATVLIIPDLTDRPGPPSVLETGGLLDAVDDLGWDGATMRWVPHTFTLTTLGGDVVGGELPAMPSSFPADFDIVAELVSAAAAELGVHRDEIFIVDDVAILYHPTIDVSVALTRGGGDTHQAESGSGDGDGGGDHDGAAAAVASTVKVTLPTERGPAADEATPATVRRTAGVH